MKLVNIDHSINIDIEENTIYELIIENQKTFSEIVGMLVSQTDGNEDRFILSDNNKEIKMDKITDILIDCFALDLNSRKILNGLYSQLDKIATDYVEEKTEINSRIINVMDELIESLGSADINYNLDFKWSDIFKLYDLEFLESYDSLIEKLDAYIKIISRFTEIRLVFLVNIKAYLSSEELKHLYLIANYNKINLFMIEPIEHEKNGEMRYIIDKDNCFIDMN